MTDPPRHKNKSLTLQEMTNLIQSTYPQAICKAEWIRAVKFGLRHKERMKAASEVPYDEQPQPSRTVNIEEFQRAVATLQRIDRRIPEEVAKKAIYLISSTNLLNAFELDQAFLLDLPSTSMLALIPPLPEISRFTMPPPFKGNSNHTWALLHGTPIETAQSILLEGKIRPANWSYNPPSEPSTLAERSLRATPSQNGQLRS